MSRTRQLVADKNVCPTTMDEKLIQFRAAQHGDYPAPVPAVREMPEWLKRMDGEVTAPDGKVFGMVKRCPPFVEAISFGYLIRMPFDVTFGMDHEGRLKAQSSGEALGGWMEEQYAGAPFATTHVVTLPNPWVVSTPAGYSTMFVHPLNRYDFPFRVLTQVVETDSRSTPVTFPAVSHMRPGMTFTLQRGTPIAQAIPVRREEWDVAVGAWDSAKQQGQRAELNANEHLYKQEHWRKKGYL